jgi:hypothetical protein
MSFEVTLLTVLRFLARAMGCETMRRQTVAIARMPANLLR